MAGPWEQYQQTAFAAQGPWMNYAAPEAPPSEIPGPRRTGADLIPGTLPAVTPPPDTRSLVQKALAYGVDVPTAIASHVVGGMGTPLAMWGGLLTGGRKGAEEAAAAYGRQLYQPRTPEGEAALEQLGRITEPLAALGPSGPMGLPVSVRPAARAGADVVRAGADIATAPVQEALAVRQARIAAERSAKSWERGAQIDAAKLAPKYDIALDPAQSNPTAANRIRAVVSGASDIHAKLSARNEAKWVDAAKDAMGLPKESILNADTFEKARQKPEIAGPYNAVRNISNVVVPDTTYQALDRLRVQPLYGDTGQAAAANAFIDNLQTQLRQGGDGGKLLQSIQQLRQDAQSIYHAEKAGNPITPEMRAQANAKMGAANALELAIEASIPDVKARKAFSEARTKMAQTYDFEAATNLATGKVDPQLLAKMAEEGKPLTGAVGDLAKIAANFPDTSQIGAAPEIRPRLTRTGVSGTIGGVIGNVVAPGVGWVPGTAIGAAAGYLSSGIGAKRVASPAYQARYAMPPDYRLPPPYTEIPRSNALVPYQAPVEVLPPEIRPNWVYGRPEPQISPAMPPTTNMLGAPSAEATLNALRAEDVRRAGVSRALGQEAEAQAAAAEAAARRPTSGEVILDFDPITGRYREASQGLKGATPETFSNFGSALETAASKVTAGKPFDLTAAEKVAWDKTRVDIAEVAPGFKTLTDKAIAEKMMDRAWVEQTAAKAREKAAAFEQIAARAKDERARQTALANRERMMSLAEDMETSLRAPRPTSSGGQGAKTREFNRNRLLGNDNTNNLTR